MAMAKMLFVHSVVTRGRRYDYFRRPGSPRVRLPGDPSCPEYHAEYARLLAATTAKPGSPREESFDHLCQLYYASPLFQKLAEKTAKDYRWHIEKMREQFGDLPIRNMSTRFVCEYGDSMAATPRKRNLRIAILRRLLGYGVKREMIATNPASKPELVSTPPRDAVWSLEAEAKTLALAPPELKLAYMLGAYTVQRENDLLTMAWSQYLGDRIRLRQAKTKKLLDVAIHPVLKATLDAAPRRSPLILTTADGRAWKQDHFQKCWKKLMVRAGVDGLHYADLRRTGMVRMSEAGVPAQLIAACSGHTIDRCMRILQTYLPQTFAQSQAAIHQWAEADARRRQNADRTEV